MNLKKIKIASSILLLMTPLILGSCNKPSNSSVIGKKKDNKNPSDSSESKSETKKETYKFEATGSYGKINLKKLELTLQSKFTDVNNIKNALPPRSGQIVPSPFNYLEAFKGNKNKLTNSAFFDDGGFVVIQLTENDLKNFINNVKINDKDLFLFKDSLGPNKDVYNYRVGLSENDTNDLRWGIRGVEVDEVNKNVAFYLNISYGFNFISGTPHTIWTQNIGVFTLKNAF
ncbi:hypothetical protein LNO75_00585 [Mycoplasma sp. T363T]|uniref:Lipoprotein n=1 Tax=Mycoplasma bradburyae TaxID=2963128 RepID=A0AAW6HRB5_9MOLU|nr:hypothetical protein [Mycoplasma bradburyae]MDC4163078.1 hypothetical protein [Mycoplasma bradburyae]MDC4182396.1 hypothetical protein [Mycoplasma bradburyae]MDC4183123.1 hypothetical protein [Mycoplasma bradburyae]UTS70642.1 hypothetical protein NMG77_02720 [Mycoplasma bradburyae]